jgi:prepilin-type N-terminal cleavage/methylation domain-containing protein
LRTDFANAGFTLFELVVSLALALVVAGAAFAIIAPGTTTGRTQPEVVDAQQRARVGQDLFARDLYMAGAGMDLGPAVGPLLAHFAPIVPRRMGLQNADSHTVARSDAITILYVPRTSVQTALSDPLVPGGVLRVTQLPNCSGDPLCGIRVGASLLVFDQAGHFDGFTVTQVLADSAQLRPWQASQTPYSYPTGSLVAEVEWHSYYLDSASRQLRHFDGYSTDIPVVDEVVGLSVEYFEGGSQAALPLSVLRDGPWCGSGENRFDADLFRIRRVRVTLRVQVGNDMMRARSSDYAIAGRSLSAARSLPDYALRFDISPRNMRSR